MEALTFRALGEPSRLQIVELLRGGPSSVGEIAASLDIRQPQASKHLRVLSEAGSVVGERVAKRRLYRLESTAFADITHWVDSFEHLWLARLDSLGRFLDTTTTERTIDGDQEG